MNTFGQSGFLAIFIQVMFNPLYWFDNQGHSFGICMIIFFVIIAIGLIVSINKIVKGLSHIDKKPVTEIISFLIIFSLFTCYYYNDVYNWWSGMPGYGFVMMIMLFALSYIIQHQKTLDKKSYIMMIILGMIACSGMMYCVTVGFFYVFYVFVVRLKNGESLVKKAIPLVLYILAGLSTLVAPGNHVRMEASDISQVSLKNSIIVSGVRTVLRFRATLISKPWFVIALLLIFIIGIKYRGNMKIKLWHLLIGLFGVLVSAWFAVLPYVYGSNKALDSEFASRVYYIEDYVSFIGFALWVLMVGCFIGNHIRIDIKNYAYGTVAALVVLLGGVYGLRHGYWSQFIPLDIVRQSDKIQTSYEFWNEILDEIEAAEPGSDVVITKTDVDWCPYVYVVSLDDIARDPVDAETYPYGNCNQCASLYYGVRSIIVNLE